MHYLGSLPPTDVDGNEGIVRATRTYVTGCM